MKHYYHYCLIFPILLLKDVIVFHSEIKDTKTGGRRIGYMLRLRRLQVSRRMRREISGWYHTVSSKESFMRHTDCCLQIKSILLPSSCMEVDATRSESDESETVECDYGQESTYPAVAVKALISLGNMQRC